MTRTQRGERPAPDSPHVGASHEEELVPGALVAAPWSVRSALGLVLIVLVLTLLAGAFVEQLNRTAWSASAQALAGGAVFFALYAGWFGIVWGAAAVLGVRFTDAVGLRPPSGVGWYAAALCAAVFAWLFSAVFTAALEALGASPSREDVAVFRVLPGGSVGVAITILLIVAVAPFAEEIVYRGVLFPALSAKWGAVAGLVISSTLFSAVHLSLVGFVPLLVASSLFALLFLKSRSLRVAITAHATFNALGVVSLIASRALVLK